MARNPKNPKEYISNSRGRFNEKLKIVLELLLQFHFSTRELILERLGLATHSHHDYFKGLEKKGILRRTDVYSLRTRFIYILTPAGKELAYTLLTDSPIQYSTDINKVNHTTLRHDLAVQKSVICRLKDYDSYASEKNLGVLLEGSNKLPDACLIKNAEKTMLEVELTPKNDKRIFRALVAHAESLIKNQYQKVIYIFPTKTLRDYYYQRFTQTAWPTYLQDEKGLWVRQPRDLLPDSHPLLRSQFEFLYDLTVTNDI
jgi:DNA-binding MarR family transcriptional regulator